MRNADADYDTFGRAVTDILDDAAQLGEFGDRDRRDIPLGGPQAKLGDERCRPQQSHPLLDIVAKGPAQEDRAASLTPWQWVMFAKPASGGVLFLGVYITRAHSFEQAVLKAHIAGHCPGGHAEGVVLPAALKVDDSHCDRLLTLKQAETLRHEWSRLGERTAS